MSKGDLKDLFDVAETRREFIRMAHLMTDKSLQAMEHAATGDLSDKEAKMILDACSRGRRGALRTVRTLPLTRLFSLEEAARLVDENREVAAAGAESFRTSDYRFTLSTRAHNLKNSVHTCGRRGTAPTEALYLDELGSTRFVRIERRTRGAMREAYVLARCFSGFYGHSRTAALGPKAEVREQA